MNRPGFLVEQQIAVQFLAVGKDAQQDQRADDRVKHLRIIERLVGIRDRLLIDALPGTGVVLDLDGEVAADGFHENAILDGDVRMLARALHVAVGALPLELHGIRIPALVVETVADIFQGSVSTSQPLERLEIILAAADAHLHVHMRTDDHEFHEQRALVEPEQRNEVLLEGRVAQGVGDRELVKLVFLIQPEQGKHILKVGGLLEAELDVVAQQIEAVAEAQQVARDAVVLRADVGGGEQLRLHRAEDILPRGVELIETLPQVVGVLRQTRADHFISAAFQLLLWGVFGHQLKKDG